MQKSFQKIKSLLSLVCVFLILEPLNAAEQHGVVKYGGLPLPGATVTATKDGKTVSTVSNIDGSYSFPDLADGTWAVEVDMSLFQTAKQEITVPSTQAVDWDMKLLSTDEIAKATVPAAPAPKPAATGTATTTAAAATPAAAPKKGKAAPAAAANGSRTFQRAEINATAPANRPPAADQQAAAQPAASDQDQSDLQRRSADSFLVNGSTNNGASTPFAQLARFGNNIRGGRSQYNGNIGFTFDNNALDARTYSLTGQDTPKPDYNRFTGLITVGGPIKIPHLIKNGPFLTINYQWLRNRNPSNTQSYLMPTADVRNGIFPTTILDPTNGQPFPNNTIPLTRISPQATSLLKLYPLPNFVGSSQFNYQIPLLSLQHQDSLQARTNKQIGRKNNLSGNIAFQSTRSDNPSIFQFLDTSSTLGINSNVSWRHTFTPRLYLTLGAQYSRFSSVFTPFFANRQNISGLAGVTGNNQEPINWGPPTLNFTSGIASLSDGLYNATHNQTVGTTADLLYTHRSHEFNFGGDYKRQQFNLITQQNPRGGFTFTGATTSPGGASSATNGADFASFLLGTPDASSIAYGNADKYFRARTASSYANDNWRVRNGLTVNVGIRWEYTSPESEKYGRLVNLAQTNNFQSVTPVVSASPINPDRNNFAPRISFAWRPLPASSMVVRGGYGISYDTSVYATITSNMSQQAPLSTRIQSQNTPSTPLTLANGFIEGVNSATTTFGVDPNFRVGYAQQWQLAVQRDLPWGMQSTITYTGIKGTRAVQQFLPNTYPQGVVSPCPACPLGFSYLESNGNSTREAGIVQVRRRLRSGFQADVTYTYAKAIDDALLGGGGAFLIAQDWLNLAGERGRSNFDQRHLVSLNAQYTSGMGIKGGTLLSGWRGSLIKEWTFLTQVNAGTGLPLTPQVLNIIANGVSGPLRPDYTGQPVYENSRGLNLNPLAFIPANGHWGGAGRNIITGPNQFSFNASMGRTFRINDRFNADLQVQAQNILNHVTYPSWNTTVSSLQYGLPLTANGMRSVQTTVRVRF